jgi:glucose-1-phosphatase
VYDGLLFTTHSAAVNLAYPLVSRIREELNHDGRKFTFLCGHDSNLASISAALRLNLPETENAFEVRTPIGSKLVFEKWSDGSDDYVAINLVYPKYRQMHARTLLSIEEPPMVQPVTIEGLTANSDGLYRLADLDARMAEAMGEYDAIEDASTGVTSATRTATDKGRYYTLSGALANASSRGIIIGNGKKTIR